MHFLVQSIWLQLWIETNNSAQQTNGFWSFSSCLSKKIRVHLYTHALRIRIRFCPGNRSSSETDTKLNSAPGSFFQKKFRSKDTIATAAMQNLDRYFRAGHSWRCFENVRIDFPDLVLLRSLPFSLNPSATAKPMVNVAVSVSEEVMWKPKWPK